MLTDPGTVSPSRSVGDSDQTRSDILALLSRKGPLYVSEISVELLVSPHEVLEMLLALRRSGIAETRGAARVTDACAPWTLVHSKAEK